MYTNQNNQLIVKSNYLIEASYKLSLQEQRLILLMASMVKPTDDEFSVYSLTIKDFNNLIGVENESAYTEVKKVTKDLMEKVVVIYNEDQNKELQVGWLSSAEYFEDKGFVELEFSPKLKPYLIDLKSRFTQYQLKNVVKLKRSYSIRIYELLKQYEGIGERYFEYDKLRYILGIKNSEYPLYANFKQRILKPAEEELPKKTDLGFSFKEKKSKRKVVGILFFIWPVEKNSSGIIESEVIYEITDIDLYLKLQNYFCLTADQAKQVVSLSEKYPEKIKENLEYVEKRYKANKIKPESLGGYTWKAIKEDYREQLSLFDDDLNKKKEQKKAELLSVDWQGEYDLYVKNCINDYRKSLSGAALKNIEDEIKESVRKENPKTKGYPLKGLQTIAIREYFRSKVEIIGFKEWKSQYLSAG